MKILINKNKLDSIVTNANSFIDKRDASSITSHILFEAKNDSLEIKATDFEIGLYSKINDVRIFEEGRATANGKKILDILRALKDEEITLETMNNYLYIRQKGSKYKLAMYNTDDYPEFPNLENKKKFKINSAKFTINLKKISPVIDQNIQNFALSGAFIDIDKNHVNLVATDTKRLSVYTMEIQSDESDSFILPKKAINEIQKIFFDEIEIYYDETFFIGKSADFEFFTKLINSKYVNYQKVIPTDYENTITLPRDKFLSGIRAISMVCEKMKLTLKENAILFESINESDNSEAKTQIEYETGVKEEISFNFTNKFIVDFLNVLEEDTFTMSYKNSSLSIVFKSSDFTTVVMPVII